MQLLLLIVDIQTNEREIEQISTKQFPKATLTVPSTIASYGCDKSGYFRRNCLDCTHHSSNVEIQAIHFRPF